MPEVSTGTPRSAPPRPVHAQLHSIINDGKRPVYAADLYRRGDQVAPHRVGGWLIYPSVVADKQ